MDGRVKTLHPRVHGGILSRGDRDKGDLERLGGARDRPRRRQPLPVRARRGRPRVEPRAHRREHRHRRPVDGPLRGQEPRARHRSCAIPRTTPASSTRSSSGGDTTPETRAYARGQGVRPHGGLRRGHQRLPLVARGRRQPRAASRGTSRCPSSARTACATARTRTRRGRSTSSATRRPGSLARAESLGAGGKELSLQQPGRRRCGARRRPRVRPPGGGRREAHQPVRRRGRGDARRRLPRGARCRRAQRVRRDRRAQPRGGRGDGEDPRRDVPRVRRGAVVRGAGARGAAREEEPAPARDQRLARARARGAHGQARRRGSGRAGPRRDRGGGGHARQGGDEARPHGRRAEEPRVRLARVQARQVERHRARARRDDGGRRRRPDVPRGFGADCMREGGRESTRKCAGERRILPVPRRRRGSGEGGGRGGRAARAGASRTRTSSPRPTASAWRWSSPAYATSGTEAGASSSPLCWPTSRGHGTCEGRWLR